MFARIISLVLFLIVAFLVFGDVLIAHANSSPQTFLNDVGRSIGESVAGIKEWFGIY